MYLLFFIFFIFTLNSMEEVETLEVGMGAQRQITVFPKSTKRKQIYTNGLAGCTAAALIMQTKLGICTVVMSHFASSSVETKAEELKNALDRTSMDVQNPVIMRELIIIAPGRIKKDSKNQLINEPIDPTNNIKLEEILGIKPIILLYITGIRDTFKIPDFKVEMSAEQIEWTTFADRYIPHKIDKLAAASCSRVVEEETPTPCQVRGTFNCTLQ